MGNKIKYTESSGSVFADLGLEDAMELQAKSNLAHEILEAIEAHGYTQSQAAKILGTHQTQISRLKTGVGKENMSFDLLLNWLTKLDCDVLVTISKKKRNQSKGEIRVAV